MVARTLSTSVFKSAIFQVRCLTTVVNPTLSTYNPADFAKCFNNAATSSESSGSFSPTVSSDAETHSPGHAQ